MKTIGVLSDTHGLLRSEVLRHLAGSDLIIHAGDVGNPALLETLAQIAPVHAVRGNVDKGDWARGLPATEALEVNGAWLYVLHDLHDLDLVPHEGGFAAVISGHSHRPVLEEQGGVLYLNPGSCGPRRFSLPVSMARLRVHPGGRLEGELIDLSASVPAPQPGPG
ncbi:hypothetical protein HNR42_000476 [Deinobacterium chartae]|uniref:Phosphoesterase n=1 Tax=Deinobacterium chartae TaxID=521158 RepID=A0A841HYT0_9DEIO|nr:hypothetical protein [Deinobacterium chartae]